MNIRRVSLAGAFWLLASSVALSQELPELLAAAAPKGNERSLADARVLRRDRKSTRLNSSHRL